MNFCHAFWLMNFVSHKCPLCLQINDHKGTASKDMADLMTANRELTQKNDELQKELDILRPNRPGEVKLKALVQQLK
jgi:hypothetical protein